jgi:hypothetical protein
MLREETKFFGGCLLMTIAILAVLFGVPALVIKLVWML